MRISAMAKLRNASSLILISRNNLGEQSLNVLLLKRSAAMAHLPSAYVFPGGNVDPADEHPDWLSLLLPSERDVQLNIVGKRENSIANQVSKAISLRIAAIRETFEECGILLCKCKTDNLDRKVAHYEIDDKNIWRNKIRNNPYEFLNLCRVYNFFPNIKSLYLISNWITPKNFLRRYDCKFFTAIIDENIEGDADGIEVEKIEWQPVSSVIDSNIFLPPPQMYELTKLKKFTDIETFCKFAVDIDSWGCESLMPAHVYTCDGFVIILPGDKKYAELLNSSGKDVEQVDCDTLHFRDTIMHRLEYRTTPGTDINGKVIIQNCHSRLNDLFNVTFPSRNSKL